MINILKKRLVWALIGLLIGISFSFSGSTAADTVPGSTEDPVVTLSYIEMRLNDLKAQMLQKIEAGSTPNSSDQNSKSTNENSVFKVIEVKSGDNFYFSESTEFIYRAGEAVAIEGPGGGLSDLTDGFDIKDQVAIPLNHLILVPREDGRGLHAKTNGWILIKGAYTVE